ncbi:dsRNA-specific ribonuclease [Metarhizium robertsii]|uniref:Dicer-like protein 1 n=2 Tax=Metarhizium robertsii TaxID=568076 RepID=E9F7F2_METRA|nr:RNA helicase, DEAD-box type, Q motif protein [Metarhizium robertsii ARSEF 23]EFY96289.2 RNA helicase, DEAD-box type, Q motif protein [Metarhizium robertsii ARSEF 23]EXU98564.1 dsRNA-specific ribonuclease [Metarhizium robertsii]
MSQSSKHATANDLRRTDETVVTAGTFDSASEAEQNHHDSRNEGSYDSDSSYAAEKYRLTTNPERRPKKPLTQNSEHAAFMSWVADEAYQDDTATPAKEDDTAEGSATIVESGTSHQRIVTTPRQYQIDLFERAKEQNTIIVLDTGSGKTYIAVLLLRHVLALELETQQQTKRTAFFLVDKVALCLQQHRFLQANLEYPVGKLYGDKASMREWASEIQENMVIVCTAQILLDLLSSGLVTMNQINLLVFDEAHHTKKNHPYATIMRDHYIRMKAHHPRILAMTASPVDSKTRDFYAAALDLEATLCSKIATVSEEVLLAGMGRKQQIERVIEYGPLADPADEMTMTTLSLSLSTLCRYQSNFQIHLEAARYTASTIGPWGADQYWRQLFKSPDQYLTITELTANTADELISQVSGTYCQAHEQIDDDLIKARARKLVTDHVHNESNQDFSLKVDALHEILHDAFESQQSTRCIVFVQKRYIAFLLSEAFNRSALRIQDMTAGFVVGSQPASSSIVNMSIKDQIESLNRFRYGEINCIFATQVAEEGIDIPECDLIIRFDLYDSAIQYIQSKGRARQTNSVYVNMVERDNIQHRRKLIQATRDVHALRRFCSSLPSDRKINDVEINDGLLGLQAKSQISFEVPQTGARLTFDSSRGVLAKFVSSVCGGADAHPEYIVTSTEMGKFTAIVLLPDSCPVKSFSGTPQRSKLLARGSAAFKACIELLNYKYIDGNFRSTLTRLLPKMRNARLALSEKKQSEYGMKSKPELWAQRATSQLFVTTLSIKGPGPTGRPGRPLCILTHAALPTIEPIRLWIDNDVQSTLALHQFAVPLTLTGEDVASLAKFTLILFNDVFSKDFDCDSGSLPYFLAPCVLSTAATNLKETDCPWDERTVIDWDIVKGSEVACAPTFPTLLTRPVDFMDRFVTDPCDGSRKFFTSGVNKDYQAFDPVPNDVPFPRSRSYFRVQKTIAQYSNSLSYKLRQSIIWNSEQPVFDAELLPLRRNLLCEPDQGGMHLPRGCFLILEPLAISTLPVDVVVTAFALPVAIYSIESAAIAMDACGSIDLAIYPPLALEALTKGEEDVDVQTSKNYERLEFLGDAFLKMATTISLFTLIPNRNEFEYHVERMILICNKNLFNHAVDRGLQEYVRSRGFDRRSWYPDLVLRKGKKHKPVGLTQRLADKSIADVCEALIGAAYMTEPEGMDLAVKAVTVMVQSKNHRMKKYSDYYEKYVQPAWQTIPSRPIELLAVGKVKASIGYNFRSPKLLRSAFKHPSYPYEPELPNYQRLEFLGDALLDVAIVDFLFQRYPLADPQWLTEHKMAMASNHFFSFLCVELGLHRHILSTGSSIMGHIAGFVEQIEKAKSQTEDGVLQLDFWLNTEHPPKALSDILEAVVGAMYEDSKYDYNSVRNFFTKFIAPYFQDMTLYDTYAGGHPVTQLTKLMQDTFCCRSWRLCVSPVPCGSDTGASAITDSNVVCALMIHKKKTFHSIRGSGKDAKIAVAAAALKQMRDLAGDAFRRMTGCDCGMVD